MFRRRIAAWLWALAAVGLPAAVRAHDAGLSLVDLQLESDRSHAELVFAVSDLEQLVPMDANRSGQVESAEFQEARSRLEKLATGALRLRFDETVASGRMVDLSFDRESGAIRFQLEFPGRSGSSLYLESTILRDLPSGHRQYLALKDRSGKTLLDAMLDSGNRSLEASSAQLASGIGQSFQEFMVLGVEHIVTGYDHLLFLFAVLLAASTFMSAVQIITSFTVAHSITLALATFDLIRLDPSFVEPLIAVSIVYVGLENIFRTDIRRRWLLTFGFGLIHGLGFASVLRDLGVGSVGTNPLIPLLSFNLGVELGQVAIAALVLPLLWRLRHTPLFLKRYAPACSLLITLAGGYWLLERTLFR